MRFTYPTLKQPGSRASRYALLVLIISLIAMGGLLVGRSATQKDKFTMAEATTTENNGKRVKAKAGFKLVAKDKNTIEARRATKNTSSIDTRKCGCSPVPPGGSVCNFKVEDDGTATCGAIGSSCCRWVSVP